MASVSWSIAKEYQPAILELCNSKFGPDCEIVHQGTAAEGLRWENILCWARLTTVSEKSCHLAIAHHATMRQYENEFQRGEPPEWYE